MIADIVEPTDISEKAAKPYTDLADLDQAQQFLEILDPDAEDFVFQCFDDSPLKRKELGKIFYGSLDAMAPYLSKMQVRGAGVFVTINKLKGRKRTIAETETVRSAFSDLDGAPLQPVLACSLEPHMIVESSPGKYHAYWVTEGLALDQFTPVQKAIAARFNSDPVVNDLPRVMRLPGFIHQKGEPFLSRITHLSDRMPYTADAVLAEFPPVAQTNGHDHDATADSATQAELIKQILTAENYHTALRNLAWRYLVSGMDPKEVRQALHGIMQAAPEPHDERWQARVNDIDRSVETAHRKITALNLTDLSDDALALSMGRDWEKDSRFVTLWGKWLLWRDGCWQADETKQHIARTRHWLRIHAEAVTSSHPSMRKAAKKLRDGGTIMGLSRLVGTNIELATTTDQWDQNQMLLGGEQTTNLVSGTTYEPRAHDYITKRVACAPSFDPPELWLSCLSTWTAGDKEMQAYLQRMCGYMLTGSIKEEVFFFFYGLGKNGKTKFAETIKGILGDYAGTMGSEVLMAAAHDRHPTEIARLRGLRLAVASEIEHGKAWAELKIKSLTGGDTLQARFMRQDFFEFAPTFKLLVIGNNKPSLANVDEAIRRRLHLVPFTVTIPEDKRDPDLAEKLKAEWPQILGWMIQGCMEWQRIGLQPPKTVLAATADYLTGEDSFEQWREARATLDVNAFETHGDLWASWQSWAQQTNEPWGSQRRFIQMIEERGFERDREGGTGRRGFKGLRLNRIDVTARRADLS